MIRTIRRFTHEAGIYHHVGPNRGTGQSAERIDHADERFTVRLPDGTSVGAEGLLVATGRRTFLGELGVANVGIDPDAPFLAVDERQRVTDGVWGVGAVGRTEADARQLGLDIATATKPVPHTARGWLHGVGNEGLIKLAVDTDRNVLVGATSAGPHGGEVLGLLTLAVHAEIPIATLRSMIYAYPTFHEGIGDALNELG